MSSLMFILKWKCKSVVKQTGFTELLTHNDIVNSFALLECVGLLSDDWLFRLVAHCCQYVVFTSLLHSRVFLPSSAFIAAEFSPGKVFAGNEKEGEHAGQKYQQG